MLGGVQCFLKVKAKLWKIRNHSMQTPICRLPIFPPKKPEISIRQICETILKLEHAPHLTLCYHHAASSDQKDLRALNMAILHVDA